MAKTRLKRRKTLRRRYSRTSFGFRPKGMVPYSFLPFRRREW